MRFEFRMAWRETRPAMKRFAFLIAAIALGVRALTGLKGFSRSLEVSISRSARDLIAADLAARMNVPVQADELRIMESLVMTGAELTRTTEMLSMVSSGDHAPPVLSDVRAVDPGRYPFYGSVDLDPSIPLTKALESDGTVVSRDLLVRSGISVGDRIRIERPNSDNGGTEVGAGPHFVRDRHWAAHSDFPPGTRPCRPHSVRQPCNGIVSLPTASRREP